MTFNPRARLDPGQVKDVRGRMGGGRGLAVGGGTIGVIVTLVFLLLGGDPSQLGGGGNPGAGGPENSTLREECRTGADANERPDCRILGYVNSIQTFWGQAYDGYQPADTVIFTEAVSTGCGTASAQVGPFYCPTDRQIYLDIGFFDVLEERLGARGGSLAEGYVVAHEYGHHLQNLEGILKPGSGAGAEGTAVRTELMADCLAGVWANNAAGTGFLEPLTQEDIAVALDAAASVGDDRIQEKTQGQVNPEQWTHGSAQQRQEWFLTGYEQGTAADCDTFSADI